jgi:uncharacterized membrane protein
MQYFCEVLINRPREEVIKLLDDAANLTRWMEGLQSFEHLSGEPGQPGAKSRLVFDHKGSRLEMMETIITKNFPEEFSGTYETKGIVNMVNNNFYEDGTERTRWVSKNEFQFSGLMNLMTVFMGNAFPKQTKLHMDNFKKFAENT